VNVLLQLGMKGRLPNVLEVLALAYIIGITSWTLVEKPALRRKDRMANFRSRRVETTAELNRSY
jgi:peptidoglycan/LPS O-acetylase OafA/YrhL